MARSSANSFLMFAFFVLSFALGASEGSFNVTAGNELSSLTNKTSVFQILAAPVYHNVSAGAAWVYPSSPYDLGARDMSCECFDPENECCMPNSTKLAPYCMPIGSTCCANTFCVVGETCCGTYCCPANTVCNVKEVGAGCCPIGALCVGPAICYDHASANCSNTLTQQKQCCSPGAPFCRDFPETGLACYENTINATIPVPTVLPPSTSEIFPESTTTSSVNLTTTVTVSVVTNGMNGYSLQFPPINSSGIAATTSYTLEWPSTMPTESPCNTSTLLSDTTTSSSSSAPLSTITVTPTISTTPSAVCFNNEIQTIVPCPPSSTGNIASAHATPVRSQAMGLLDLHMDLEFLKVEILITIALGIIAFVVAEYLFDDLPDLPALHVF